jgi:hypothetical protein
MSCVSVVYFFFRSHFVYDASLYMAVIRAGAKPRGVCAAALAGPRGVNRDPVFPASPPLPRTVAARARRPGDALAPPRARACLMAPPRECT